MAAHFCPQCGHEVSSAARFCPNCAHPLGIAASGPATAKIEAAASGSRRLLVPALVVALIVLAVALVLAGRKQPSVLVSEAPMSTPAPSVLSAPTPPPTSAPALTNAPAQPATSVPGLTNAPMQPPAVLPPDVVAYLTFLQQIEQRRMALNNDLSGAMAMMTVAQGMQGAQADPEGGGEAAGKQSTQKLSQGYADYAVKWQTLIRDYRVTPVPPACFLLSNSYLKYLSDYTTVITKLQVSLLNHDSSGLPDLSSVAQVQAQVDADGASADGELGSLCGRYRVPKPFSIGAESASPSLLGH